MRLLYKNNKKNKRGKQAKQNYIKRGRGGGGDGEGERERERARGRRGSYSASGEVDKQIDLRDPRYTSNQPTKP